jgi:MerR family transcriptional regulator, mercuric resistance operon regulatory protein
MERMTIGVLAAASGIKITTIRFYERAGLMPAPTRTAGKHRNYTAAQLRRLLFICRARELEFSIEEIRMLLVLAEQARPSCRDVQRLAASHLKRLRRNIADLMKVEAVLSAAVKSCSGKSITACPVLELLGSSEKRL